MLQSVSFAPLIHNLRRISAIALCALVVLPYGLLSASHAQLAARTLPRSLDQMSEEAERIVHGYVTSVKLEPHPQLSNLTTVVVSMTVKDTYKGTAPKSLVFRQYVWDADPQGKAAHYGKGQELVLLLGPVSEYGLTSPIGLEQGTFRISRDRKGHTTAVNGRGNVGLFKSVAERARTQGVQLSARTAAMATGHQAGPVALADLEDAIRTFARTR